MEFGECSSGLKSSSSADEIRAKLVSSDSRYQDVEIRSDELVICSETSTSSSDKPEWCKITINPDLCSATLQNRSANTIFVDKVIVQVEDSVIINSGSEIVTAPDREGSLSYRFLLMHPEETCKKQLKISVDVEHAKCSICLNIWHDVVTVAPCLHNFCNGCFSEWLRRSQQKKSSVICPQCRGVVQFVGRNHFLHNIAEDILRADSSLERSKEEIDVLDSCSSIKSNLVIGTGRAHQRKRSRTAVNDDEHGVELRCPQCVTEYGGFRCNSTTVHLQCQACGGMMPSRTDISVPQHCLGCDRPFCCAYWHVQRVTASDLHPVCSSETFKPISEHRVTRLPFLTHESNRHEQEITDRCISQSGRTLQDVISDWIVKLNNREIDRARMPLNHAEMITATTPICRDCYDKLVSFLLYWFRISLPKYLLPPDASKREDCWYGYACRTQHHSEEHARKRNHVCRPTRGSHT